MTRDIYRSISPSASRPKPPLAWEPSLLPLDQVAERISVKHGVPASIVAIKLLIAGFRAGGHAHG